MSSALVTLTVIYNLQALSAIILLSFLWMHITEYFSLLQVQKYLKIKIGKSKSDIHCEHFWFYSLSRKTESYFDAILFTEII